MSSEALELPQSADVPLETLNPGASLGDLLTYSGITWGAQQPVEEVVITHAIPLAVIPPGVTNSRAYQAIISSNGNAINVSGVFTIVYNGAIDSSFLFVLPIATTNWIPGFNQFNGIANGEGAVISLRQNALANNMEFSVVDSTNVGDKNLHIHYNINYLLQVEEDLPEILV